MPWPGQIKCPQKSPKRTTKTNNYYDNQTKSEMDFIRSCEEGIGVKPHKIFPYETKITSARDKIPSARKLNVESAVKKAAEKVQTILQLHANTTTFQPIVANKPATGAWNSNHTLINCNKVEQSKIWTYIANLMQERVSFRIQQYLWKFGANPQSQFSPSSRKLPWVSVDFLIFLLLALTKHFMY